MQGGTGSETLTITCAPEPPAGKVASVIALWLLRGPRRPRGPFTHEALVPEDACGITAETPLLIKGITSHLGDM